LYLHVFIKKDICISLQQNNPADFEGQKNPCGILNTCKSTGVQRSIFEVLSFKNKKKHG